MAKNIKAGVELTLKDGYSAGMRKAGAETGNFADKTLGVINDVDKALSGAAAKLAAFGLSFSLGAVTKDIIELDHRMTRVGLTANAGAEQIAALKRAVFEAAKSPDIKIGVDSIVSGLGVVMERVGDLQFVEDNVRNLALAIQASGESGDAMGAVFSEFAKFGYTMEEILPLMDDLIAQGDQGAFTFGEFAKNAPAVFSAYSVIGTTPEHIRKANAAMQILMAGTKSADIAVTSLSHTMAELSDLDKQDKLKSMGIFVRDLATNEFRDFNDIMFDIVAKAEEMGNADYFGTIFGTVSMQAIRAYMTQGGRMYEDLVSLGDTAGLLQQKSAEMAKTIYSNIQGLKTSLYEFADMNLAAPLAGLAKLLNELTAHPERVKRLFTEIALGLGAVAAVKGIAGVARIIESMKGLKSGSVNLTESLSMASAMPVYVTNWGGAGLGAGTGTAFTGAGGMPPRSGLVDQYGNPISSANRTSLPAQTASGWRGRLPSARSSAATMAGVQAVISAVGLAVELNDLLKNKTLSDDDRRKLTGGATGNAIGSVAGAAGGAFLGTLILPGVGTVIGGMIGSQLGGAGGRWAGETLGAWKDRTQRELEAAQSNYEEVQKEATDTLGKTEEEIENIRRKLAEAEARLQSAKEANDAKRTEDKQKNDAYEKLMNAWASSGARGLYGYRRPVDDLIVTPQGQFSTHPDDYIFAMKNPAALAGPGPRAAPPVIVGGEIVLRSELSIDDKGYRLRQSAGRNTTPYKFAVGSAKNARLI